MGLGNLVGRGGAEDGCEGGPWDIRGQDAEGMWANGGEGGRSDEENTEGTEIDQPQQGLEEPVMLMGLGDLVGRGGAGVGSDGGTWGSGGQNAEGVWAHGGDGGGSDHESKAGGEEDQPQQGLEQPMVLMGLGDLVGSGGAEKNFLFSCTRRIFS